MQQQPACCSASARRWAELLQLTCSWVAARCWAVALQPACCQLAAQDQAGAGELSWRESAAAEHCAALEAAAATPVQPCCHAAPGCCAVLAPAGPVRTATGLATCLARCLTLLDPWARLMRQQACPAWLALRLAAALCGGPDVQTAAGSEPVGSGAAWVLLLPCLASDLALLALAGRPWQGLAPAWQLLEGPVGVVGAPLPGEGWSVPAKQTCVWETIHNCKHAHTPAQGPDRGLAGEHAHPIF